MNEDENDQLNEIHSEVKGSHAQLGIIDERTRHIEEHLDNISDDVEANAQDINGLEGKVKRNTTVINAVTVGLSGLLVWISDKLMQIKLW